MTIVSLQMFATKVVMSQTPEGQKKKRQVKAGKMQTLCRTEPHWEIRHHSILLSLPPLLITLVTSGTTSATPEWSENIE